jgi:hypothetical protein
MFCRTNAAAMPQMPTTIAARSAATVNDRANDGPLNSHRPPQNSPGKDRLLGVGCWLRREAVRTFVAVCCERALLAKSVAQGLSGNNYNNLPCSFAARLRCSLVAYRGGYAPRSLLAGRQNPGGILPYLFPEKPFCALRVRAAPSRLIAPSRPPINRRSIPRLVAIRSFWSGRALFGLKQGMLLFQFLPLN